MGSRNERGRPATVAGRRAGSSANRVIPVPVYHVILGCGTLVFKPGKFQANEAIVAETCLHRDRKQISDCQGLETLLCQQRSV